MPAGNEIKTISCFIFCYQLFFIKFISSFFCSKRPFELYLSKCMFHFGLHLFICTGVMIDMVKYVLNLRYWYRLLTWKKILGTSYAELTCNELLSHLGGVSESITLVRLAPRKPGISTGLMHVHGLEGTCKIRETSFHTYKPMIWYIVVF